MCAFFVDLLLEQAACRCIAGGGQKVRVVYAFLCRLVVAAGCLQVYSRRWPEGACCLCLSL